MRIALVNVQLLDGNNVVAPLGVLYIAGQLERDGHTVAVWDGDPDAFALDAEVAAWRPDAVGIGFLTAAAARAHALLARLKARLPGAFFFAGGVHPTIFPEPTLRAGCDVVVLGEGEATAAEVIARVVAGSRGFDGVAGTAFFDRAGQLVTNAPRALLPDLEDLPRPARHLIDFTPYLAAPGVIRGYSMHGVATVFATRGCPYGCIYCGSHTIFGRRIRYRPVEDVVDEIEELRRDYGVRGVYFCDDLFTLDKPWVETFCAELRRRVPPGAIRWACQTRVDAVHLDLLRTMRAAGCVQIDFGVESGSQKVLQVLSRKTARHRIVEAFRAARATGLRTCATFIVGSPEEKREDIDASAELAAELDADYTAFYFATPYPGTRLWDLSVARGWLDPSRGFDENWVHRQPSKPILTIEFSADELIALRRRLANPFFARNYLRWRNVPFFARLASTVARRPRVATEALARLWRSRRLEDAVEWVFARYQHAKYEEGNRRTRLLRERPSRPRPRIVSEAHRRANANVRANLRANLKDGLKANRRLPVVGAPEP